MQELLRKNPEQRIQSVPELLRRLKICLRLGASEEQGPPPAPAQKEDPGNTGTAKEKKTSPPKIKFSPKKKNSEDSSEKPGSRIAGKKDRQSTARAGRKPPSFSKKKTETSTPKGPAKAGKFKRPEKKKSFSSSRKGRSSGAGANLSGNLIDRGDDADIFEDRFEEENNLDYAAGSGSKKSHPFIMGGTAVGVVIAALVVFMTNKSSNQQLEANADNSLVIGQKKNEKRKNLLKKRYETEIFFDAALSMKGRQQARDIQDHCEELGGSLRIRIANYDGKISQPGISTKLSYKKNVFQVFQNLCSEHFFFTF